MEFNNLAIVISSFALIISIVGFLFNAKLDQRKLKVKLEKTNTRNNMDKDLNNFSDSITMWAYNNGQRPVTIINYNFKINATPYYELQEFIKTDLKPKHILKQGEICYLKIKKGDLSKFLAKKGLTGEIEISGFFEGADGKKYIPNKDIKLKIH